MLKLLIVVLFLALLASLLASLVFLLRDKGTSRRSLRFLGLRVTLAVLLLAAIGWGFLTGQLGSHAPWRAIHQHAVVPVAP